MNERDDSFPMYPTSVLRSTPANPAPIQSADAGMVPSSANEASAPETVLPAETTGSPPPLHTAENHAEQSMPEEPLSSPSEEIVDASTEEHLTTGAENKKVSLSSNSNGTTGVTKRIASTFEIRIAALRARIERRDTKLARIIEFTRNRGSVRNDDIKKILRVSDATATRYARILVERGDLIEKGKGRGVMYVSRS